MNSTHQHEQWMIRDDGSGPYCAACGDRTPSEVTVTVPIEGQYPVYPQAEAHTWGAFAFLAIEMGGYGDLEVVNPYNGVRLNAPVFNETDSQYVALHRLINEMEKADFLRLKARKPNPERELTADDFGSVLLNQQVSLTDELWADVLGSILTKRVGFVVTAEQALDAWQRLRPTRQQCTNTGTHDAHPWFETKVDRDLRMNARHCEGIADPFAGIPEDEDFGISFERDYDTDTTP